MKPILILDPGHGGEDPGGGSNKYWLEKNMALKITKYQYKRFKELGVPVVMTRTEDKTLGPSKRARQVRWSKASYCLSNHINAGGGQGAEFIHSIYSEAALSQRFAQAFKVLGQPVRRIFTRTLESVKEQDYYYMHRDTGEVETVIIEYGFADNTKDTEFVRERWEALAEAVVKAFCEHINHPYVEPREVEDPSTWAKESWKWVVANGLLDGNRPRQNMTREEVAVVLHRLARMLKK